MLMNLRAPNKYVNMKNGFNHLQIVSGARINQDKTKVNWPVALLHLEVSLRYEAKIIHVHTMWGPRLIAKLVNITPITMVYGIYNYSYWGFC
jgi:hypothetical protein